VHLSDVIAQARCGRKTGCLIVPQESQKPIGFDNSQLAGLESLDCHWLRFSRNRSTQTEHRSRPGNPKADSPARLRCCGDLDVTLAND
jgi:hypothetical protein